MIKALGIFWRFSRPHTIIGSFFSITTLYLIALRGNSLLSDIRLYGNTLMAALGCNIFIVGLNQLIDIELDKINKPQLPLASGALSVKHARQIIFIALAISIVAAALASWVLLLLILVILLIGVLYSVPPVQLKKHHLPAALCITLVRGILVNLGILFHFVSTMRGEQALPVIIWPLTLFIVAFSIAIAWFKDLPDTEGDALFQFRTFPLLYSKPFALKTGIVMVSAAYLFTIGWSIVRSEYFLVYTHIFLLTAFWLNAKGVRLAIPSSVKTFYLRFWVFFFAAYLVFGIRAML
jgi:homogentisate phytyltransferase / homogentisate geranylgeranyltransferase